MSIPVPLLVIFTLFGAAACTQTYNDFTVHDPDERIDSTQIRLCETKAAMIRTEDKLTARVPIVCEGSGDILVKMKDDSLIICEIGYVASGLDFVRNYEITEGNCLETVTNSSGLN